MSLVKHCIKLAKGKGYFCHAQSNRVVVYDADDPNLSMDLHTSRGELLEIAGDVLQDIYCRGWYDNHLREIEDPLESLWEYADVTRVSEEQTVYIYEPRD